MSRHSNESPVAAVTRVLTLEHGITPSNILVMKLIDAVRDTTPAPPEVTIGMLSKILQSLNTTDAIEAWATRSAREIVSRLSKLPQVQRVAAPVDDERLWCSLEGTIAGMLLRVCCGQDLSTMDPATGQSVPDLQMTSDRDRVERFCCFLGISVEDPMSYALAARAIQKDTPWCCVLFQVRIWDTRDASPGLLDSYREWLQVRIPPGTGFMPCPSCAIRLSTVEALHDAGLEAEQAKKILAWRADEKLAAALENLELSKFFVKQWKLSVGARHFLSLETAGWPVDGEPLMVFRCGCGWKGTPCSLDDQGVQAGQKEADEHRRSALRRPGNAFWQYEELTDAQLAQANAEELRTAYRELLTHHVSETTELHARLRRAVTAPDPPGATVLDTFLAASPEETENETPRVALSPEMAASLLSDTELP